MPLDPRTRTIVLSVAAAGAGCTLAYLLYRKRRGAAPPATATVRLSATIEKLHAEWLSLMTEKYTAGDQDVALAKLIAHCERVHKSGAGAADTIFKEVRCNSCDGKDKVDVSYMVLVAQLDFVGNMMQLYNIDAGIGKALRIIFEYAINDVEAGVIFSA